jgi:hypothetical protein
MLAIIASCLKNQQATRQQVARIHGRPITQAWAMRAGIYTHFEKVHEVVLGRCLQRKHGVWLKIHITHVRLRCHLHHKPRERNSGKN